jgi:uncharacterized protein YaaN involved in tellurite resistance
MNALLDGRSKIPLIGQYIDKLKLKAGSIKGHFDTTKVQIDKLVSEVDKTQNGLRKRNEMLEDMFGSVKEEYRLLGLHIAAGKMRLQEFRAQAEAMRAKDMSPRAAQDLADLDALISNLDIRVGNLITLQQSSLQTLPQIRMVQTSNHVLVDKFHTIREITVPAWKRQFMIALGLNEQRNAVQLADNIDDTTNELLRRNAELLHRNATQTAKANQRLVIDTETLKKVQETLIRTVEDVIKIQQDGVRQRQEAEKQIYLMRDQMQARLKNSGQQENVADRLH